MIKFIEAKLDRDYIWKNEGTALTVHNVLFYNWTHTIIFLFLLLIFLFSFYVVFHLWEWLYSPVKALNLKEKILFFSLKILCACSNILIFIIAHRNLILPLYFYRYSSLEYSEKRSFYDVDDNSFLFFFVLIVPLEKNPSQVYFFPFFFLALSLSFLC